MGRRRRKSAKAMLFVLTVLLLPAIATRFMSREGGIAEREYEPEEYYILSGQEKIPLEEYLTGAAAYYLPADYEDEAYKAIVVVLRSSIRKQMGEAVELEEEKLSVSRLHMDEMKVKFGADFSELYARYQAAVRNTRGAVLRYEGELIDPCFHQVSAGMTNGLSGYPYLSSVESVWDIQAENYLTLYTLSAEEFYTGLMKAAGKEGEVSVQDLSAEGLLSELVLEPDAGEYRQAVVWKNEKIEAGKLQEEFRLPSPAFSFEEYEGKIRIMTKGLGHGMGMSLYGAGKMAEEGKSYKEILTHYYSNITVSSE